MPYLGKKFELLYPTSTLVHLIDRTPRTPRRIVVTGVRDLVKQPITVPEFFARPYLARSRWLVRAWDEDIQSHRQFYLGSSDKFRAPGCLRIALDCEDSPRLHLSRQFEPTVQDRRKMLALLRRWLSEKPELAGGLRIIADDMRLHVA
jgi:hypothetical protein